MVVTVSQGRTVRADSIKPSRRFRKSRSLPEVNAAATVILLVSLPLIAIAAYLMREEGGTRILEE